MVMPMAQETHSRLTVVSDGDGTDTRTGDSLDPTGRGDMRFAEWRSRTRLAAHRTFGSCDPTSSV
jgi:hypothetical protein